MIAFTCRCGQQLKVKDEFAGKQATCPHCKQPVRIPAAAVAPTIASDGRSSSGVGKNRPANAGRSPELDATVKQPVNTSSAAAEMEEKLDFLAPAQKPGELGRLGPYRVLKILGAGGMGLVLHAEDPVLKRHLALKVMRPELAAKEVNRQRFLREAQATAAVEHPYIVHIHQVGEERGVPFIAMPFLKGEPLDARLKRENQLPVAEAVRIARQTAEGLAAAHKSGLIHRDIKPANLWLEAETGWVKILDFGLARAAADDTNLTQSGAILGTPAYMAPEQGMSRPVDFRCDLFSLGAVLYRMLTGVTPFQGADTISLLMALATENPRPVRELNPSVPPALADLVMRLLAKDPAQRPPSAKAVAEALAALEEDRTAVQMLGGSAESRPSGGGAQRRSLARAALLLPIRLLRIPGRIGLVVKCGMGIGILFLLLFLFVPRGSRPEEGKSVKATPALPTKLGGVEKSFTNSLGMQFVRVPKGKFLMGGGGGIVGTREVDIPQDFYLGKYEVTQEEWEKVMLGMNPSHFSRNGAGKNEVAGVAAEDLKRFPVENVSWDDAQEFLTRLNAQEKRAGWVYRLPNEAEWEYACRGGPMLPAERLESGFDFYLDRPTNTLMPDQANFNNGLKRTCKVGSYLPNRLGLHDMHGNVWEWCDDAIPGDPKAPPQRVYRGGGWLFHASFCRAANRTTVISWIRIDSLGVRVARVPAGNAGK